MVDNKVGQEGCLDPGISRGQFRGLGVYTGPIYKNPSSLDEDRNEVSNAFEYPSMLNLGFLQFVV